MTAFEKMYDYSKLLKDKTYYPSWETYYNPNLTYPQNILHFFKQSVILPYDFYNVIAAYSLIPSALANRVPYLFFYGVSGSGKSTLGKLIAYMHGITITSSETTYAAIRNSLRERKHTHILIEGKDPLFPSYPKKIEANTFMVWEDINSQTFLKRPEIYNLFKFGYDKSCDTIQISSEKIGKNETFRCFCPKVFSSIDPIHSHRSFKELRRRLIVIPTKKLDTIERDLLDIDQINWCGFSRLFNEFWDYECAEIYLSVRVALTKYLDGLTSTEKTISLDLIATGIATGIWKDETLAVKELRECFNWLEQEKIPLENLLENLVAKQESIYSRTIKAQIEVWYQQGYLLERPTNKEIIATMRGMGYRSNCKGSWVKQ